jgi:hypothetical protein
MQLLHSDLSSDHAYSHRVRVQLLVLHKPYSPAARVAHGPIRKRIPATCNHNAWGLTNHLAGSCPAAKR